ncbi:Uncharacterised protein [Klebsiella pneumoniae]|nr:Uncharacterised protein [Klebsiella pneumoniae]
MPGSDILAFLPFHHVHPGRLGRYPDIHVFGEKVNPCGNLLFRFLSQAAKIIPALAYTQSGICLLPYRFIKRIIILIEGKDNGKIGVIFYRAFYVAVVAT